MKTLKTAIGLMSGTSMDGIDGALLRSDGRKHIEILAHLSFNYEEEFRRQLKEGLAIAQNIKARYERPGCLAELEEKLTLYHGELVKHLLQKQNLRSQEVDLIGFHGQTVLHRPNEGLTVQLGDGNKLARQTGIKVVFDMRANDMTHGGQGAPMVPIYHQALATQLRHILPFPCVFINIGGIANLTYIRSPDQENLDEMVAFDCGPGNCLIDQWMERRTGQAYDAGGQAGLKGKVNETILKHYLDQPFFQYEHPQAFDWHDFAPLEQFLKSGNRFSDKKCGKTQELEHSAEALAQAKNALEDDRLSLEDGAATLAALTARAIFNSFRFLPSLSTCQPQSLIISGGGSKNACIMAALADLASKNKAIVSSAQECGLATDFIEAEAWAYLAIRASKGLPLSFPKTTGVQFPVTGGQFALC